LSGADRSPRAPIGPANHEFYTSHGETRGRGHGYFDYSNGYQLNPDGTPVTHGFTTGSWAGFTQPQPRAADHARCTLAYWHQPTFSATNSPSTAGSASCHGAEGQGR
jgi:hypothetical protein